GGPFCGQCGQADTALDVPFRRIVGELLAELFNADSRAWRTARTLLLRPGLLTAAYNAGRRARYLPPLRVYMLSSLLVFFVVATRGVRAERAAGPRSARTCGRRVTLRPPTI